MKRRSLLDIETDIPSMKIRDHALILISGGLVLAAIGGVIALLVYLVASYPAMVLWTIAGVMGIILCYVLGMWIQIERHESACKKAWAAHNKKTAELLKELENGKKST
jgi:energy-coupling factor transporter transmembrane protein EcfT